MGRERDGSLGDLADVKIIIVQDIKYRIDFVYSFRSTILTIKNRGSGKRRVRQNFPYRPSYPLLKKERQGSNF